MGYCLNNEAWEYLKTHAFPKSILCALQAQDHPSFKETQTWNHYLDQQHIEKPKHRQTLTEAALWGN